MTFKGGFLKTDLKMTFRGVRVNAPPKQIHDNWNFEGVFITTTPQVQIPIRKSIVCKRRTYQIDPTKGLYVGNIIYPFVKVILINLLQK